MGILRNAELHPTFNSSIVQDTVGTSYSISFMFARPNNKVITAALTRSYEKNSTVLNRSQNCCSVNELEADFSCGGTVPARRARHGEATWAVAGSPGAWDQKIITSR